MITDVEYLKIVNEVYDLSDYHTKKAVLFCNEAQKVENVEGIVSRLYQHIKNDVNAIDFGTIPRSKGIITNIANYGELIDCISSIHDLVSAYNEPTKVIDEFTTAMDNIQRRERQFTKAFALNIEFPIMLYNITVTSIVSAISLLISASVEFIKNGHDSFEASFDKVGYHKSKDHVLHEYISQFNRSCADGTIDKIINGCIKNNVVATREGCEYEDNTDIIDEDNLFTRTIKATGKSGIAAGVAVASQGMLAIPGLRFVAIIIGIGYGAIFLLWSLRKVLYYFMRSSMSISDWFEAQATYLQINAENLKYRDDPRGEDHQRKVYQRQMKWVERFRKISNTFALKDSKAQKEEKDYENNHSHNSHYEDNDDDGGLF